MGITSFGWSRPTASNRAARGYSSYSSSSSSKKFSASDVKKRNNDVPKTSLGLQGRGICRSCSSDMYGVGAGNDDASNAGSCIVQKPGYSSNNNICGGLDDRTFSGGLERRGRDNRNSRKLYYGAGAGVNGTSSSVVRLHHHRLQSGSKFGTIGVATGKKMAIVSARINEKLAHLSADLRHNFFCAMHPRVLRLAAKESNIAMKSVATERRRQKEAQARDVANKKRALVRQQPACRF